MNENTTNENIILTDDGQPGFVCADCGAIYPLTESIRTANGDLICEECRDRDYGVCEDCDEIYPLDELTLVNPGTRRERYVCSDCLEDGYTYCDVCEEYYEDGYIWAHDSNGYVCDFCHEHNNLVQCEDCGAIIDYDEAYYDEDNGCYYCEGCWDEHSRESLCSYGYKPDPVFGTTDEHDGSWNYRGTAYTFGVELEIDDGDSVSDMIHDVKELTDRAYCKHDGSLGGRGVEIVTHPGTLAWHRERFPWAKICKAALDNSYRSHDTSTCGLHVHVGRAQMANYRETPAKMDIVMARYRDVFKNFARRTGERWCKYTDYGSDEMREAMQKTSEPAVLDAVYEGIDNTRYRAVNVTNDDTVEIRIFKGTLKYETLMASIELVSNLVGYCDTHDLKDCLSCTWDDIVHYEELPELTAYNSSRVGNCTAESFGIRWEPKTDPDTWSISAEAEWNVFGAPVTVSADIEESFDAGDLVYLHSFGSLSGFGVVLDRTQKGSTFVALFGMGIYPTGYDVDGVSHGWHGKNFYLRRVLKIGDRDVRSSNAGLATFDMYRNYDLLPGMRVKLLPDEDLDDGSMADTLRRRMTNRDEDNDGVITGTVVLGHRDGSCVYVLCVWDNNSCGHGAWNMYPGSRKAWYVEAKQIARV